MILLETSKQYENTVLLEIWNVKSLGEIIFYTENKFGFFCSEARVQYTANQLLKKYKCAVKPLIMTY